LQKQTTLPKIEEWDGLPSWPQPAGHFHVKPAEGLNPGTGASFQNPFPDEGRNPQPL
jgi:hypothetical protein